MIEYEDGQHMQRAREIRIVYKILVDVTEG